MSIRLFIADTDPVFTAKAASSVSHAKGIEMAGCASDGMEALRRLSELPPCVLLTDVQLPGLDGISLLRRAQALKTPPVSIACARFYSDVILDCARQSGACYFLYKPIQYSCLPRVIESCWNARRARDAAPIPGPSQTDLPRLRELLHSLGIPSRMSGSAYAMEGMLKLMENESLLNNLSKGLYAELAGQMQTTPSRIERSLRSAIAHAYDFGSLGQHFSCRPSNRAFLRFVLEQMRDGGQDSDNLWL